MTLLSPRTLDSGARPPIPPPFKTTFDGSPDDDSWLERIADEVRQICRFADAANGEDLQTMLELLDLRRQFVIRETLLRNALDDSLLPPLADMALDYLLAPSREGRRLQGLLDRLDDCRARCERRLTRYRFEVRLSRDLGAS